MLALDFHCLNFGGMISFRVTGITLEKIPNFLYNGFLMVYLPEPDPERIDLRSVVATIS